LGGHAISLYIVRQDEELFLLERGKDARKIASLRAALNLFAGRHPIAYQRIFGHWPTENLPNIESLKALGKAMMGPGRPQNDSEIPAGYTYLGQFVLHDITYMKQIKGVAEPVSLNSPTLDLDSVLPEETNASGKVGDLELILGCTTGGGQPLPEDLPREREGASCGRPLIADDRNDDFLPLAQCHLLLIKFYNAIARWLGAGCKPPLPAYGTAFRNAVRELWVEHFQAVVLHDYLVRLVDEETYDSVMTEGCKLVASGSEAASEYLIPLEVAGAVGRFGHSMIRDGYEPWNSKQAYRMIDVRHFMDLSYANSGHGLKAHAGGLPRSWVTDWTALFDLGRGSGPIRAAAIDTRLAGQLSCLPECIRAQEICSGHPPNARFNLAEATLLRGRELGLSPARHAIEQANAKDVQPVIKRLTDDQLVEGENEAVKEVFRQAELSRSTPLWYYVLKEAEVLGGGGNKLGPLGGRILMETLYAAIERSTPSILSKPDWRPSLPAARKDRFTIPDLILFSTNPDLLRNLEHALS